MVVTIPRLGNTYLAAKVFFDTLSIPCVIPDVNNKNTLQKGARVSPEEICLPFKVMMGNFLECIKKGADTIVITGSCGPCRFGEYCELQMKLLKKLGCDVDIIVIDSPGEIGKDAFWHRISQISSQSGLSTFQKTKALFDAYRILCLADDIDAAAFETAGYESDRGACKSLLAECKKEALTCSDIVSMRHVLNDYKHRIDKVKKDSAKDPLRITLVGEIYSMVEPFGNLHIEEKLMDYGASSFRHMTPSWWINDLIFKPLKINSPDVKRHSKPYLAYSVGGHARESIAHTVMSKRDDADGVIQIYPMGCMPEIVTRAILPAIQHDTGVPVMTLVIDEMTGEAGYLTRIEAFLDMLESRRKKRRMHA